MKATIAVAFALLATSAQASLPPVITFEDDPAIVVHISALPRPENSKPMTLKKSFRLKSEAQISAERLKSNISSAREYLDSPEGTEDLASYLSQETSDQIATLQAIRIALTYLN